MVKILPDTLKVKNSQGQWQELVAMSSGSGSGSEVEVNPILDTGVEIAKIIVDGTVSSLYAPEGGGAEIDDSVISTDSSWSSSKTKAELNKKASLDSNGYIPSSILPSYVDDVLEYSSIAGFPSVGETGKIYVDTNENKTYRWSGTVYVAIGSSLALGETSSTAYAGDKGKAVADKVDTIESKVNGLSTVATSGSYNDLTNKPTFATVATSGSYNDLSDTPQFDNYVDKTGDTMTGTLKALDGDIAVAQVRNIYATSTAVTEGVTALTTGSILLVYEE